MTQAPPAAPLPALRRGGRLRRALVLVVSAAVWFTALVFIGTGISPGLGEPTEREWPLRVLLLAVGVVVAALPWLLIWVPAQRLVRQLVAAVVAAAPEPPALPPYATWGGPQAIFQRTQVQSYTVIAPPLLLLIGTAVAALFLGEPVAAGVFFALALVPAFFVWVTWALPRRLRTNVELGLVAGQVVPIRVERRLDQTAVYSASYLTWFDAVLPDGQHLVLRTPLHYTWTSDARGVVDASDLVLVLGKDGHQGLLLAPSRPESALWLLGPVPLTRVPAHVLADFTAPAEEPAPATDG